jgi:hypothetical protein
LPGSTDFNQTIAEVMAYTSTALYPNARQPGGDRGTVVGLRQLPDAC